jgi:uncharacterized protein YihD (DUF1040 family)
MHCHRVTEILELISPFWLKNKELSLLALLAKIAKDAGYEDSIETLTDEVIIYHLKLDQEEKGAMIPGIAKDCENDFQAALLRARGLTE